MDYGLDFNETPEWLSYDPHENFRKPDDPDSDLVYKRDNWNKFLWREFREENPAGVSAVQEAGEQKNKTFAGFHGEVFSRLYEPTEPERLEDVEPEHEWAKKAHEETEAITGWDALRESCRGDEVYAGSTANIVAREIAKLMPEPEDAKPEDMKQQRETTEALQDALEQLVNGGADKEKIDKMRKQANAAAQQYQANKIACQKQAGKMKPELIRQAIRTAVEKANGEIDDNKAACEAFGCGDGTGSGGRGADSKIKKEIAERFKRSEKLRKVVELAGRMRNTMTRKQATKAQYSRDEIGAVEYGDSYHRMLPSEALLLCDPDLENLLYAKAADRSLLQYELKGKEKQIKGPLIVLIDSSGSMAGEREIWSKALALAVMMLAGREKRAFKSYQFTSTIVGEFAYDGSKKMTAEKTIELMDYIEQFKSGGTAFEPVLKKSVIDMRQSETFSRADVILITDGFARTSNSFQREYKSAAEELGFVSFGILIGVDNSIDLENLGFDIHSVNSLMAGEEAVTEELFSKL